MGFLFNSKLLETGLDVIETKSILKEHFWSDHEYYIHYVTTFIANIVNTSSTYGCFVAHDWYLNRQRLSCKQILVVHWFVLYFDTSADAVFTFKILLKASLADLFDNMF